MHGKFLIILSALFLTAALAFASLKSQFDSKRTDSQQPIEPARMAHRDTAPPRPNIETATVTKTGPEIAELSARIQQLQKQLDNLRRSTPASGNDQPNTSVSMPPQSEAQERQRTMQTTAFLHANFVGETKDPVWSLQAERQVADTFNLEEVSTGSQLQQLSCQSTLCRIESRHKDPDAERAFIMRLGRLESFGDAEAFSERNERPDGSVEIITYVSRSGRPLPRMEVPE